ncbi:MAG: hypothetical protein KGD74_01365 [Candidatus Lokiarchaeota archaeon]|nr:hypothetical protein [Candidatus Lokiarchaeota archaeon]
MKGRNLLRYVSIFGLIFPFLVINVVANPIVIPNPYENHVFRIIVIVVMFIIAVWVEYGIFNYSKLNNNPREDKGGRIFLKINLITIPPAQVLGYVGFVYLLGFFWLYILGIEVLIIIIEWFLIRAEFKKKYDRILPSKDTLIIVTIANAASFLIGLIPFQF